MHPARILFFIAVSLALGGCTAVSVQTVTPTFTTVSASTETATLAPSLTFTSLPTETSTPTLAPTPMGGGGMLLFSAYRSVFSGELVAPLGDFNVYAAQPDGSGLTALTNGPEGTNNLLAGPSPDGRQVLYYSTAQEYKKLSQDDNRVELWVTDMQSGSPVQLTTEKVHSYLGAATWADDGTVFFVGWDMEGMGLFRANSDGTSLARVAKPVNLGPTGKAEILFFDSSRNGIYWLSGAFCSDAWLCGTRYYWTALDGSDQKQVWQWLKGATDRISLSPDSKWLLYEKYVSSQKPDSNKNGCYVVAADGSADKQMPGKYPHCYMELHQDGQWSPDGKSILYLTQDWDAGKYPQHVYSPETNTTTDGPDLQTPSCEGVHWLPDRVHVLFTFCRSNMGGYDSPTASRIVNMNTGEVTLLEGTDYCNVSFSPDMRRAFMYDCHSLGVGDITFKYFTVDLETYTVTGLFTDVLNSSQEGAWWTLFVPLPWQAWSK